MKALAACSVQIEVVSVVSEVESVMGSTVVEFGVSVLVNFVLFDSAFPFVALLDSSYL